jgi:hypothetical protein
MASSFHDCARAFKAPARRLRADFARPAHTSPPSDSDAPSTSRFEGYATPDTTVTALDALIAALAVDGLHLTPDAPAGAFRLAQYGTLFTLETRVNEVQVGVVVG